MSENLSRLVEVSTELELLREQLRAQDPELYEFIQKLEVEKAELVEAAKVDLRALGTGAHTFGKFTFKVAPGGIKKEYDTAGIEDKARQLGHEDLFRQYKVFKLVVDPAQIERLPPEIRPIYEKMFTSTQQSAKVTLPKGF